MKIQQAQFLAQQKFNSGNHNSSIIDLLRIYARREKSLWIDQVESFANEFEQKLRNNQITPEEYSSFFTWYYINYVAGFKNGRLKSETVINASYINFLQSTDNETPFKLYEAYAKEELEMDEARATQYAASANFEVVEDDDKIPESERFYIWYYITYMAPANS